MRHGYLFACSLLLLGGLAACSGPAIYNYDYDVAYSRGEAFVVKTTFGPKCEPVMLLVIARPTSSFGTSKGLPTISVSIPPLEAA